MKPESNENRMSVDNLPCGLALSGQKAEKKLRFLSFITENIFDSIVVTDTDFAITYLNKKAEELYGYSLQEVKGQTPGIFNTEPLADQIQQEIYETVAAGRSYTGESLNRRKDGSTFICEYKVLPILDEKGAVYAYAGIQRDITRQKEQERQLKKSEEQLNRFFSQSLHGFFFMMLDEPVSWDETTDKEKTLDYIFEHQRMTKVNQAMLDQYGATEDDFIGLTPGDLFAHDLEHGRYIWKGLFDEGRWHVETREQRLDGTPIIIEGDYSCLYDEQGRITGHFGVQMDVTAQKRMQEKLKENEERLNTLISQTPAVIYSYRFIEGIPTVTYVNENVKHVLGFAPEDFINNPEFFSECLHPEDAAKLFGAIPQLMAEGRVTIEDYRFKDSKGRYRWLHDEQKLITYSDDTREVIGAWWDVTDRKEAEEALKAGEEKINSIFNNMEDAVWSISWPDYKHHYISPSLEKLYGRPAQELMANPLLFKEITHPDDQHLTEKSVAQLQKEGKAVRESRLIKPDGSIVWVLDKSRMIYDANGLPVRVDGLTQDITERKLAEQRLLEFKAAVDQSADGIAIADLDGKIRFTNNAWAEMHGYPVEEFFDFHISDFHTKEQMETQVIPVNEKLKKQGFVQAEVWHVRRDGEVFPAQMTTTLLRQAEDGKPFAMLGIARDITDRKATEAELKRSNEELEQFAYAVSHDMRQPLRMVNSYLQLLEKELGARLDEDTKEYLHFALDGAKRMDQMILGILDYSRVGRKSGSMQQIDSREALDEALLFLEPDIRETEATIKVTGEWPRLWAIYDEITRLFQNLIGNALKYRERDKKPEIEVTVQENGNEWLFSVRDNGIGIDPSQVERLFKVFSRLHARNQYEGAGVGLALCRKIVEHHGGRIRVESAGPGLGSTFYFSLNRG